MSGKLAGDQIANCCLFRLEFTGGTGWVPDSKTDLCV